jgi:hypothetical protein
MESEVRIKVETLVIIEEDSCSCKCIFLDFDPEEEWAYCSLFQHFLNKNIEGYVLRTPDCLVAEVVKKEYNE